MKLKELLEFLTAQEIEFQFNGDESKEIDQVSSLLNATENQITFFTDTKRAHELTASSAGAVFLSELNEAFPAKNSILVKNPYYAFAKVSQLFNTEQFLPGIDASASIDSSAQISPQATICANVVIGAGVVIEAGCYIGPGSVVMDETRIKEQTFVAPNVTVLERCEIGANCRLESGCIIGGQGFGFANEKGEWARIPQIGRVVIGDRVFIGNNASIHRGAIDDTVIESNCIIDSLVHVAHNVQVGYGSAIAGQVGFAGSAKIGRYCTFGGQAGIAGHIEIADQSHFGAKSGVTHTIKKGGSYSGFPAVETPEWQKNVVRSKGLEKMAKKIKALEKELEQLKLKLES